MTDSSVMLMTRPMDALFDDEFIADSMPLGGSGARARKSDPVASHTAADRSAVNRRIVLDTVLRLVRERGHMTGSELNEAYELLHRRSPAEYPKVHFDTPRKRAGELARVELIEYVDPPKRGHEGVYRRPSWQVTR
jgi:hypothetical protein